MLQVKKRKRTLKVTDKASTTRNTLVRGPKISSFYTQSYSKAREEEEGEKEEWMEEEE